MTFEVGKRVVAESESTDRPPRTGVIQEVIHDDPSPRYRIRWDDGHESIYTPASGALRAPRSRSRKHRTGQPSGPASSPSGEVPGYYQDEAGHIHILE